MSDLIIVNRVFCDFLSVKCCCGSLDWPAESIIIIALMISHFDYLIFSQVCGVYYNLIVDWTGWCHLWVLVRHHIKVKMLVVITKDYIFLYNSSWIWIQKFWVICILEESCYIVFIKQNIQNLGIVILVKLFNSVFKLILRFEIQKIFFVRWTSYPISINNNLTWTLIFVDFSPIF